METGALNLAPIRKINKAKEEDVMFIARRVGNVYKWKRTSFKNLSVEVKQVREAPNINTFTGANLVSNSIHLTHTRDREIVGLQILKDNVMMSPTTFIYEPVSTTEIKVTVQTYYVSTTNFKYMIS